MALDRPQSCPVLVGRDDLTALATRRLDRAAAGEGHLLFLAGEAGIGKTRLLAAATGQARERGFALAAAAAFPQDVGVPGAILLDLADELRRSPRPDWVALGDRITRALLADGGAAGDPHRRRRLLVLELAGALAGLAAAGPVLLACEDLHWADDLALQVLGQLARRVRGLPMLVVGTYRSDELYPLVPMREWRSQLLGQRLAEETRLTRLSTDQTAAMAWALLGGDLPPPAGLVSAVQRRSDGIPLHVEEILGATRSGAGDGRADGPVPDTLTDAVLTRAAGLSEPARAVADAAAVLGRTVDVDLLAEVADEPVDVVDRALDELTAHFLVVAGAAPGTVDFRHALIRDVLAGRVPPGRWRRLHGRVAVALRRRSEDAAALSYHFEQAGDPGEAHRQAALAAARAAALSAHREAVELYRRALRCSPGEPGPDLLAAYAAECAAVDDNAAAAETYERAIAIRRAAGESLAAAALVPPLVGVRHLLGDDLAARAGRLEAASADLPPGADAVRGQLQAGLAAAYMLDRRLEQSIRHGGAALASASAAGDLTTELNALVTLGSCSIFAGPGADGWAMLEQGVRRAREARREAEAARAYRMIGSSASVLVEYDRAERWLREGIDYAERVELWNHRHYLAAHLAHVAWATGDWAAARDLGGHALADGRGGITTRVTGLHVRGYEALGRGDWPAAEEALGEAREIGTAMAELQRLSPALWGLAEAAVLRSAWSPAVAFCEQGRAASAAVDDGAYLFPFLVTGTRALLGSGEVSRAAQWASSVGDAVLRRGIPGTLPAVDHASGLVALAAGSTGRALALLTAARDGWAARRRVWEGLGVAVDLGRCHLRANRPAAAVAVTAAARAAAARLDAAPLVARADAVLALATGRGGEAEPWAPLTYREYEVARLVAAGRTNREIAAELRISVRTVGTHVEHILTRLDVTRRAGIASWVASVDQADPV